MSQHPNLVSVFLLYRLVPAHQCLPSGSEAHLRSGGRTGFSGQVAADHSNPVRAQIILALTPTHAQASCRDSPRNDRLIPGWYLNKVYKELEISNMHLSEGDEGEWWGGLCEVVKAHRAHPDELMFDNTVFMFK